MRNYQENDFQENNNNGCNNGRRFNNDEIKNTAILEFETCGRKHTFESNEVEAKKIKLTIFEEESCNVCFCGDTIEYKTKIFNDSRISLFNTEFKDTLDRDVRYENNTFMVDGKKETPYLNGQTLSFRIPELKDHKETVITFKVRVL